MKSKKRMVPKLGIAMRFNPEDHKLITELQKKFGTTEVASTVREAMIRAGQAAGVKIVRVAESVGYRVEL